ncbi:hypothetical protein OXYTRIMIC_350 [Oxytricha trifallax]|uniref:Uncharacterized protein n=1 Tax=Oxytricha trifallax TaxID=1172189 RepID=A0A073HWZ4_9SPIT|nr:hypothetical protein OXYTRIMIC_350 [Oxytricha trifallax]
MIITIILIITYQCGCRTRSNNENGSCWSDARDMALRNKLTTPNQLSAPKSQVSTQGVVVGLHTLAQVCGSTIKLKSYPTIKETQRVVVRTKDDYMQGEQTSYYNSKYDQEIIQENQTILMTREES